jgi:hypothetical protein
MTPPRDRSLQTDARAKPAHPGVGRRKRRLGAERYRNLPYVDVLNERLITPRA